MLVKAPAGHYNCMGEAGRRVEAMAAKRVRVHQPWAGRWVTTEGLRDKRLSRFKSKKSAPIFKKMQSTEKVHTAKGSIKATGMEQDLHFSETNLAGL